MVFYFQKGNIKLEADKMNQYLILLSSYVTMPIPFISRAILLTRKNSVL